MHLKSEKNTGSEKDWSSLIPLINTDVEKEKNAPAIFHSFSNGVDISSVKCMFDLEENKSAANTGHSTLTKHTTGDPQVSNAHQNIAEGFQKSVSKISANDHLFKVAFRPFCNFYCNANDLTSKDVSGTMHETAIIHINDSNSSQAFFCLSTNTPCDLHYAGKTYSIPFYTYTNDGKEQNNINDCALQLFNAHYHPNEPSSPVCYAGSSELRDEFRIDIPAFYNITKQDIFHYVYAVLHHPAYRNKYALHLQQAFPRIPLYSNFGRWVTWGKELIKLHNGYLRIDPFSLKRTDAVFKQQDAADNDVLLKPILKTNKKEGKIEIDAYTTLSGIPRAVWDYKLGNHSALEWALEPFKEPQYGKPLIAERIKGYKFWDYKEHLINLLHRVCQVSIETMNIVKAMP